MPPHSSYLRLDVRGGLNNQRECIVNGIVAAHELGLHLVLPSAHPVGQGNEKYDPHDAKFEGIYADRTKWPDLRFGSLFDVDAARGLLHRAGIRASTTAPPRLPVVTLPAVEEEFPDCMGLRKVGGTCIAQPSGARLFRALLSKWDGRIRASAAGPTVFDARKSLCWNAYASRNVANCSAEFPVACPAAFAAVSAWNGVISDAQRAILTHVRAAAVAAGGGRGTPRAARLQGLPDDGPLWAAVHVRIFGCSSNVNRRGANETAAAAALSQFEWITGGLRKLAEERSLRPKVLYLVSSLPKATVAAALPAQYTLISKDDVAGLSGLNKRLPFEVCAAIDYGIAVAAPVYAGMRLSSFDVFASAERRAAGRQNATVMRPGGKMCGGT